MAHTATPSGYLSKVQSKQSNFFTDRVLIYKMMSWHCVYMQLELVFFFYKKKMN